MARSPLDGIIDYLRAVTGVQALHAQPDVELVRRFVSQADDAAFAALLKRHGPMVLGICRRILHNEHLAEDAFQATFLVLARNAQTLRKQRSVASWLHGVALRVARKAKKACAKANLPDTRNPCPSSQDPLAQDPLAEASWRETLEVLDEELQRLPDKYRLPLVLCYLEGMARDEAATQLGWTTGKLRGQLERARDQLRARLLRRGVTLAEAGAGVLLADTALAARVPPLLAVATVKAAVRLAAGKTLATCGVSTSVITLTKGGVSVMTLKTLAVVSALVMVTGLMGAGAAIVASPRGAGSAQETRKSGAQTTSPLISQKEAAPRPAAVDAFGDPLPVGALARFGSVRWRHGAEIHASALSPDGKHLVTASGLSIAVWDLANGKMVRQFTTDYGFNWQRPSMCISPDGKRLGYVHSDIHAFLWDLETGKEILRCGNEPYSRMWFCQFSANGKDFIIGDKNRLWFLNSDNGKAKRSLPIKSVLALSPDGRTYLAGIANLRTILNITVGDAMTGKEIVRMTDSIAHGGVIKDAIAFAPDSQSIALVNAMTSEIQICELATLKVRTSFPLPKSAIWSTAAREGLGYHIGFSADGRVLLLGTAAGLIHRWDLATNLELPALAKHISRQINGTSPGFHYLPDGKTIISVGEDGVIRRWDAATGKEHCDQACYAASTCAALSLDGHLAAVSDATGKVDLWDVKKGRLLRTMRSDGPAINKLAFAPDCKSLAVGFRSGEVWLYDVQTTREARVLPWITEKPRSADEPYLNLLLFSPDGRFLYVSDRWNEGHLLNLETSKIVWRGGSPWGAAWHPDGKTIAAYWWTPHITLLDAATGKKLSKVALPLNAGDRNGGIGLAFAISPDRRRFAIALSDETIALFESGTLRALRQIKTVGPRIRSYDYSEQDMQDMPVIYGADCLAFSPDGKWLITDGPLGAVRIWDTMTLTEVLRLEGHEGEINTVAFSPDGKTALSCASDGQTYLWDLRPKTDGKPNQSLEELWTDLASADAKLAYQAVWALSADLKAVDLLATKITAAQPVDKKTLAKLLNELSSDNFQTRQAATKSLSDLGDRAAEALTEALKKPPSLEAEQRMRRLLDAVEGELTPSNLQQMRALKALELAGTEAARRLLQQWAAGAPGARLTEEAKAALARVGKARGS